MSIQQLIERSKTSFEDDPDKLPCANEDSPLVVVKEQPQLLLEPIWVKPVDDFEGPLYQKYIKDNPKYSSIFVRREVAKRLYEAADALPKHLKLVVRAGHRPLAVQGELLQMLIAKYLKENSNGTKKDALKYARTFVSDPAIKLPPHCCGAAVDVDVLDAKTRLLLDFGCPVNTDSEIAYLYTDKINTKQQDNRLILLTAMLTAGFVPCHAEWWHYSYGDSTWAYFYDQPQLLYSVIEPKL